MTIIDEDWKSVAEDGQPADEWNISFFCIGCGCQVDKCTCEKKQPVPGEPYFKISEQGWGGKFEAGPTYVFPGPEEAAAGQPSGIILGSHDDSHLVKLAPGEIRVKQRTLDNYGEALLRRLSGVDQDAAIVIIGEDDSHLD